MLGPSGNAVNPSLGACRNGGPDRLPASHSPGHRAPRPNLPWQRAAKRCHEAGFVEACLASGRPALPAGRMPETSLRAAQTRSLGSCRERCSLSRAGPAPTIRASPKGPGGVSDPWRCCCKVSGAMVRPGGSCLARDGQTNSGHGWLERSRKASPLHRVSDTEPHRPVIRPRYGAAPTRGIIHWRPNPLESRSIVSSFISGSGGYT